MSKFPLVDAVVLKLEQSGGSVWEHQRRGVRRAYKRRGTLLDMGLGTGKTLTAILLAHAWESKKVLVTCPLSVVGVWPREMRKFSPLTWNVARCDEGTLAKKLTLAKQRVELADALDQPVIVVVNHESLWRTKFGAWARGQHWDLLVVDECHRAKAPGGKLSRYLSHLAKRSEHVLGLSGTPLPHSPLDLYAQARFIDPRVSGSTFVKFRDLFAVMGGFNNKQVMEWKNTERFAELFASMSFSVTKEEALDLPPEVYEQRFTKLEPAAQKVYDDLDTYFWAQVGDGHIQASNALAKMMRLQQVTSGDLPIDDGTLAEVSHAKASLLNDTLSDVPKREPVVVFCRFHSDLDRVNWIATTQGRRYAEVSGRRKDGLTPDATMQEDVDVLGVQIQAGGIGIDLTRACLGIDYSVGFNLGDYLQSRARLHRPGQERKTTYIQLIVEKTIDVAVFGALRRREEVIENILNRGRKSYAE